MITSLSQVRTSTTTAVTAASDLGGAVYFHWYLDGGYVGMTTSGSRVLQMPQGERGRIDVLDTIDPDFDPVANAPAGYPSRRTLVFNRSLDAGVAGYRVEESIDAGGTWTAINLIAHNPRAWSYSMLTEELTDLGSYIWRVVPVDQAGNDGTPANLASELIVRNPDPPNFTATFDPATTKVTLAAA